MNVLSLWDKEKYYFLHGRKMELYTYVTWKYTILERILRSCISAAITLSDNSDCTLIPWEPCNILLTSKDDLLSTASNLLSILLTLPFRSLISILCWFIWVTAAFNWDLVSAIREPSFYVSFKISLVKKFLRWYLWGLRTIISITI